jgi:hypothetical protein
MSKLRIPKGKVVRRPRRDPDLISKRGIPYWFAPDWVRDLNGAVTRVCVVVNGDNVTLNMVSKEGNVTFIQGSIQKEFKRWCLNRQIDAMLLGVDIGTLLAENWSYVDPEDQFMPSSVDDPR